MTPHGDRGSAALVEAWIGRLQASLAATEPRETLFASDALWKDLAALGDGPRLRAAADGLATAAAAGMSGVRVSGTRTRPRTVTRAGRESVEAFLEFDLPGGGGEGVVRLAPDGGQATEITTVLTRWDAATEQAGALRPGHDADGRHDFAQPTGYELRAERARFEGRDPEVLVVGGGQAGLSLASRLARMGIDALVVEQNARIGDNWRSRYRSLRLHNTNAIIGLPYFPIPSSWEEFLPKDRIADWLEYYANAMDIACWTSTALERGRPVDDGWEAELRMPDGSRRTLRPRHLVLATGVSGVPRMPELPGLGTFRGRVLHSTAFHSGAEFTGRRALVVGTGSSGHDVAQDLHEHGARVTMLQRGPVTVARMRSIARILDASYAELPQEDADLLGASFAYPTFLELQRDVTRRLRAADAELLAGLAAAGFAVDFGADGTGPALKYLRQGGGFYLDAGCSGLIAAGEIDVLPASRLASFEPDGIRLDDGELIEFEVVVAASGFEPQRSALARLLGEEAADAVGPVWGLDDEGFPRNVWRPTALPGLWFMLGNIQQCRFYSRVLATQLARRLRP